jgi:DNA-nicking Smr family endonuclease
VSGASGKSGKSGKGASGGSKSTGSPFDKLREMKTQLAKAEEEKQQAKQARVTGGSAGGNARPMPQPQAPARRAPMPRMTAADAQTEEEERMSFHRMMSGVTPLDEGSGRVPRSQTPKSSELARPRPIDAATAAQREADEVHAHLRDLIEGNQRFEVQDDGRRVEGRRVDLPREVLRKLRHGTMPIDARMDLHGLGAHDAREALEAFLRDKRVAGERCVLVVHGKGEHSPRGQGVLRGEISAWLSQGPASEHVGAFATAEADDGGEGAVYVLLRR